MTNFAIFGVEKWGFNKDEVGDHIGLICKERDEIYEKYVALMKKHKNLNERYKSLKKASEKAVQ